MTHEHFIFLAGVSAGIVIGVTVCLVASEWKEKPKKKVEKKNYGKIVNLTLDLDPEERAISD